ncbi:MAG: DUF835 domain-containing protein [Thermoplasmatota archaeon]|nr:DUF835 domain-containing protein [Candidatus Thermoplasmatota archaeon]MBU1914826.1 DUF835 domain-containing protein [Candidatus Thermoplasmatota archaeon]
MTSAGSSAYVIGSEPKPGNVYLVEERRPKVSFELFDQQLSAGYNGLIVTRDFPKKLLSEYGIGDCRMLWLTNLVGDGRINPTAIGILMSQVRNFVEGAKNTVVVLDGLDYLITLNTYDRMLQFMHQLRDTVVTNDCILIVPMDPRTVGQRELALLERCMEPIVPRSEGDVQEESVIGSGEAGVLRLLDAHPR